MTMKIEKMESIPANENPFLHDMYHMGVHLGTNVTVMYEKFKHERHKYIIIVNTLGGDDAILRQGRSSY